MTAIDTTQPIARTAPANVSPLLGAGTFFRKELLEWLRSWRALILLGVTTFMMTLTVVSVRLAEMTARGGRVPIEGPVSLDPTVNVLAKWPEWVFFFAIVFSANLFIVERDRGTLAWTLSKPVSRTALFLAKWAAAMVMFTIFGLVLPMIVSVAAAIPAYGMPDLGAVALATVLLAATPAFFLALTLALATVLPSSPPVAGIALGIAVAPGLLGNLLPSIPEWLPPTISPWAVAAAMGQPVSMVTPLAWAAGTIVAIAFGIAMLRRVDL